MSAKGRRPLRFLIKSYERQKLRRFLNAKIWRGAVFAYHGHRKTWPNQRRGRKWPRQFRS
jgi:hypothetical protein